jgi:hypothetical protein
MMIFARTETNRSNKVVERMLRATEVHVVPEPGMLDITSAASNT